MSSELDLSRETINVRDAIAYINTAHVLYEKMETVEKERFKILLDIILEKWSL